MPKNPFGPTLRLVHASDTQDILEFDIIQGQAGLIGRFYCQSSNKGGDTDRMVLEFPLDEALGLWALKITQQLLRNQAAIPTPPVDAKQAVDAALALTVAYDTIAAHANRHKPCVCSTCEQARDVICLLEKGEVRAQPNS